MNQVTLEGTIASAPQQFGKVTKARVATTFESTKTGATGSDYHSVVAFGKEGSLLAGLSEGDSVRIDGRLNTATFERQDGSKGYETRVITNSIKVLSSTL